MHAKVIRIIYFIAIPLIVFPEPVTTIVGLLILVSTDSFSKKWNSRMLKIRCN